MYLAPVSKVTVSCYLVFSCAWLCFRLVNAFYKWFVRAPQVPGCTSGEVCVCVCWEVEGCPSLEPPNEAHGATFSGSPGVGLRGWVLAAISQGGSTFLMSFLFSLIGSDSGLLCSLLHLGARQLECWLFFWGVSSLGPLPKLEEGLLLYLGWALGLKSWLLYSLLGPRTEG